MSDAWKDGWGAEEVADAWRPGASHGIQRLQDLPEYAPGDAPGGFLGDLDNPMDVHKNMWYHLMRAEPEAESFALRRDYWNSSRPRPHDECWPWMTLTPSANLVEWKPVLMEDLAIDWTCANNFVGLLSDGIACAEVPGGQWKCGFNEGLRLLSQMTKDSGDPDDPDGGYFNRRGGTSAYLNKAIQESQEAMLNPQDWHYWGQGTGDPLGFLHGRPGGPPSSSSGPSGPSSSSRQLSTSRQEHGIKKGLR